MYEISDEGWRVKARSEWGRVYRRMLVGYKIKQRAIVIKEEARVIKKI